MPVPVYWDRDHVTGLDWESYPILRFPQTPAIEVELIQRLDQPPLGVGEPAPVAAALGNAVFDATGVRFRTVPLRARMREGRTRRQGRMTMRPQRSRPLCHRWTSAVLAALLAPAAAAMRPVAGAPSRGGTLVVQV